MTQPSDEAEILAMAVLTDIAIALGVPRSMIPDPPVRAMRILCDAFVRMRSVRQLRRHLEAIVATMVPRERGPTH